MEEWRAINGYEGLYEVSNMGRVKSLNYRHTGKKHILKPGKDGWGYLFIYLCKEGSRKKYTIHRLVLTTYNPVENMDKLQVNHINEKKADNRLDNLEWMTCKENCNHGTRNARVAEKNSIPIVQLSLDGKYIRSWKSSHEAERDGFNRGNINSCCKGRLKTHGGFRWCYLYSYISKIDPRIKKVILFDKEYLD